MRAGDTYAESVTGKSVNTSNHQDKADGAEYIWSTNLYKCTTTSVIRIPKSFFLIEPNIKASK